MLLPDPTNLTEDDRKYYRDEIDERAGIDEGIAIELDTVYLYEARFALPQDPALDKEQLFLAARVTITRDGEIHQRIVLGNSMIERAVELETNQIYDDPSNDAVPLPFARGPAPGEPSWLRWARKNFGPWAYFAALKEYVEILASTGIRNTFSKIYASVDYKFAKIPSGFNFHVQMELIRCVVILGFEHGWDLVTDIILEICQHKSIAWVSRHFKRLNKIFFLRSCAKLSADLFLIVDQVLNSIAFRRKVAGIQVTHPDILALLARSDDEATSLLARTPRSELYQSTDVYAQLKALGRTDLVLGDLGRDQREVLSDLEHLCGKPLPHLEGYSGNSFGYQIFRRKVSRLGLVNCGLQAVPSHIFNLTGLESLSLADNAIGVLPDSFSILPRLNDVYLDNNQIQVLPPSFETLANLRVLSASHNKLTQLPAGLATLTRLHNLSFDDNLFEEIPLCMLNSPWFSTLDFSHNALTSVPPGIGQLQHLNDLTLDHNKIRSLPDSIDNLKALTWLYLDNNAIEELPASIGGIEHLFHLTLYGNPLPRLPPELNKCPNLRELHVDAGLWEADPTLRLLYDRGLSIYLHRPLSEEVDVKFNNFWFLKKINRSN